MVFAMLSNSGIPLTVSQLMMSAYFPRAQHWARPSSGCIFSSSSGLPFLCPITCGSQHSVIPKHCLLKHSPASHGAIQRCSEKETFWKSVQCCSHGAGICGAEEGLWMPTSASLDLICMLESMKRPAYAHLHSPGLLSHKKQVRNCLLNKSALDLCPLGYKMCVHNKFWKLENKSHGGAYHSS